MSASALVSIEDYFRHSGKPNCEYWDGAIIPKPMPTKQHSLIQYALLMLLRAQGVQPYPELTLRTSQTRFLVPDVAVAADFPGPYPTQPVLLCCEILSPEDRLGAIFSKCEEYHAWGVPFCWVVDPIKRTAWEYHLNAEPTRVTTALNAGELCVTLTELFSTLDASQA
jgi:Uma2 family endonuclease